MAAVCSIKPSSYQTTTRKRPFDERGEFLRSNNNNFDLAAADETFNMIDSLARNRTQRHTRIKSATIRTGANIQNRLKTFGSAERQM